MTHGTRWKRAVELLCEGLRLLALLPLLPVVIVLWLLVAPFALVGEIAEQGYDEGTRRWKEGFAFWRWE